MTNKWILSACALFALSFAAGNANAQNRDNTWDFGVIVFDLSSENFTGMNGTAIDVGGDIGWGFTSGYHFTDHLQLNFDIAWARPDYRATQIPEDTMLPNVIQAEYDYFSYQFTGVYNFIDGPFSPFLSATAGWTNIDSNIIDGPPTTGCWYDPWWGYICDTFVDTYDRTRFSYGAGVGFRYDTQGGFGIRGSYNFTEIDTKNATESAAFDVIRFDLIWRF